MKALCIYAQKDKKQITNLEKHLHVPRDRYGMKIILHEHCDVLNFNASNFNQDINGADIIFLLVSVDSINITSWKKYADLATKRQKQIPIVPIKIDNTSWIGKSFEKLQSLPTEQRSIKSFKPQKEAFSNIENEIIILSEKIDKELQKEKKLEKERKDAKEHFIFQQQLRINLEKQKNIQTSIFIAMAIVFIFLLIGNFMKPRNSNNCLLAVKPETYFKDGIEKEEIGVKKENQEKDEYLYNAIKQYTCAIQIQPNYYEAYVRRGKIYLKQKDYELAIRDYDKAISLNPENPFNYYNRGEAYYGENDKKQALTDFEIALDYFKKDPNEKGNVRLVETKIQSIHKSQFK